MMGRLAPRIGLLLLVWGLALFPHVPRALRQAPRWWNAERLIEPDHPAIAAFSEEIDRGMPSHASPAEQATRIERAVRKRITYTHDWDQWWNADYWPTASETLASGREDCDGIAILTAGVLRHRGLPARLEGNCGHIWVAIDLPGAGTKRILGPDSDISFSSDRGWTLPRPLTLLRSARGSLRDFPWYRWTWLVLGTLTIVAWNRSLLRLRLEIAFAAYLLTALAARELPNAPFIVVLTLSIVILGWVAFRRELQPAIRWSAPAPSASTATS
ncbi:MAG: transglutaminase domain-containing protein [Planctomycetes bacterium]|nr:transglutaminase domain-containing protein [Planctomycetota bacterium]